VHPFPIGGDLKQISIVRRGLLLREHALAGRAANSVGSFLNADAPGDDSIFGTDAGQHEDISHNGSSGFGGNADPAEVADLAVHLMTWAMAQPSLSPIYHPPNFPGPPPGSFDRRLWPACSAGG
jgi:hypothetical protein